MKISGAGDKYVRFLGQQERRLPDDVLRLYPRIPPAHQPLSKSGKLPDPKGAQRLLDEALAEQRQQCKRQVQNLLQRGGKPEVSNPGWRFSLSAVVVEWLMQAALTVRVCR